jgi:hypothetical protein
MKAKTKNATNIAGQTGSCFEQTDLQRKFA